MSESEDQLVLDRLFRSLAVASSYNIKESDIIVIFRWGSRLWGTSNKSSDHDLVVIHSASHGKCFGATPCPGIDVKAVSDRHFEHAVCNENDVACWLPLLLPTEALLFCQDAKFAALKGKILKEAHGGQPRLEPMLGKLAETLSQDAARAAKNAEGGVAKKAQKIVLHSYRLVRAVGLVLEATGMITNNKKDEEDSSSSSSSSSSSRKKKAAAAAASSSSTVGAGVGTIIDLAKLHSVQDDFDIFCGDLAQDGVQDDFPEIYSRLARLSSKLLS